MTDEVWKNPNCWDCKGNLIKASKWKDCWKCEDCDLEYMKCSVCENNDETTFESCENLKGTDCVYCDRWACCSCFQHTGEEVDARKKLPVGKEDRTWTCDECARNNKKLLTK